MLRDVILPLWMEHVPKELFTFLKKDGVFEMWTGQRIYLRSCERPDAIRGLNLAWAWADELAMVRTSEVFDILQARIGRTKDIPNPCIYATTTPRGYNWMIKKWQRAKSDDYKIIRARSYDNPYMPQAFIDALIADYGEDFAKQEIEAEIIETAGLVWPLTHSIHSAWDYSDLKSYGGVKYAVAGVDWGFSQPCSVLTLVKTKSGHWFVVEEWYKKAMLPQQIYDYMRDIKLRWKVRRFYCDSAEPARVQEANLQGLHCTAVKKGSGSINAGLQEVRQLLHVKGDGKPRLYIHKSCKALIREADDYHYDDDSDQAIGESGDHSCDALRYAIHSEQNAPKIVGFR